MVLDFWKIAMRPGKPLMVGSLANMRVLGLPGNPVSSLVCGILFLEPLLFHMRHQRPKNRTVTVSLTLDLPANDHRQDYIRSELIQNRDGSLMATPFGKQDSSMMKVFSNAGCLVIRPPLAPAIAAGERCEALLLKPPVPGK
jgi:molybdopterin molybdotransferase